MKFKMLLIVAGMLLVFWSGPVFGEGGSGIKGVMFADYYYRVQNHSPAVEGRNAFAIRRIYFTYENNLFPDVKFRFRLESAHPSYGSSSKIHPFVKHAFLEWKNIIPRHKLYLGIAETIAFKNSEKYWGYRSIEKTIMDLNKISSSADMGVALKGDLYGNLVHHWITVFNGTGYGSAEVDRYKKFGYSLWLTPAEGLIIEGYADYEKQNPDDPQTEAVFKYAKEYRGSSGYYTLKGFVGYKCNWFTLGAETFLRTNKQSGIKDVVVRSGEIVSSVPADVRRAGVSLFGWTETPLHPLRVFARYDYYDPNLDETVYTDFTNGQLTGGADDEYSLIIAGLDFIPRRHIHLMPNILIKNYFRNGKNTDLTARVTLYLKYDPGKMKTK